MEGVLKLNMGNWKEEILDSEDLVVVEFWSPLCPYCRMIEPVFQELSKMYSNKLKFAKLNIIENQDLAAKYGVMGTPTFKFFCGGRPVQDIVGSLTKDYMEQAIEFAIKKHKECTQKSTPQKLPYIS